MDLQKIRELIELVEASGISELEVRQGDESIRIVRPLGAAVPAQAAAQAAPRHQDGSPVRAPMAGTFYAASEPDAEPYVVEGQAVAAGDVLCIIESMKMMNEIKAERSGTVSSIDVANGQAVNAGTALFHIA